FRCFLGLRGAAIWGYCWAVTLLRNMLRNMLRDIHHPMARKGLTEEQRLEILRLADLPDGERPAQREIARRVGTTAATVCRVIRDHASDRNSASTAADAMRGRLHALPSRHVEAQECIDAAPTAEQLRDYC